MATPDSSSPPDHSDLRDLIGPVWRRKWLLLAIVVASTVGTYTVATQRTERFRSSTQVFVSNSQIEAIVRGGAEVGTDRSTLDQAKLVLSRTVSERVIRRLRLAETPSSLTQTVTAAPVSGSNFVSVTAERRSAAEAAAVANAYVQEYIRFRNGLLTEEAADAISKLRTELDNLPARGSSTQQRRNLQNTIRQLQATQATGTSATRQTDRAVAPTLPFTPRPKRDAAFAFAISLAFGLALVLVLERFDRRIKNVDDLSEIYGVPLLATIPHSSAPSELNEGKATVPKALREPCRSLRTNLQFASLDKAIERIVVTSAIPGEGKSTVVRNLALTYREWGLSVAVLEADLRRPSLTTSFGVVEKGGGLTSVLSGDMDLDSALIDIDFDIASLEYLDKVRVGDAHASPKGGQLPAHASKLVLLPSGAAPPNPQAVLAADRMRRIIDELSGRYDVLLIDTPPLLAVSDAVPLMSQVDGVILVTRVGITERPAAENAMAVARLDPAVTVLGVVANDVAYQPGYGYGYGYGYRYGYSSGNGRKAD